MSDYVLPHTLSGERARLTLMAELLDPFHREQLLALGLRPGWRCLELGCGVGSVARWLAQQVGPSGHVVASDIDLTYVGDSDRPNLEVRRIDILHDRVEPHSYDLITARALLHHLADPRGAVKQMIHGLKAGGHILLVEPDMLPATVTEPPAVNAFWQGWMRWSRAQGIDYSIGRKLPAMLTELGCTAVTGQGRTEYYYGTSPWANYWLSTIEELRGRLLESGDLDEIQLEAWQAAYSDPSYWTAAITFVATAGRVPTK